MRTRLKAVECFRKKAPSEIFDRVLNMSQILNMLGLHRILNDMNNWNLWKSSEHATGSGYVLVLNILRYIIYATASGIFKTLDILERFSFWHIKAYLGIALTYLDIFVTVCKLGIFRTLLFSEPCQTCTM